jgi:hypothetical protein
VPTALKRFIATNPALSAFAAAYFLGFSALALTRGNLEFVFYGVVMLVLIAMVLALDASVRFSRMVLWGLALWGFLHMAGGNIRIPASLAPDWQPTPGKTHTVLYNFRPIPWLPKFDQFVHAFGFFVATLASFEGLRSSARLASPTRGIILASALCGMGLGATNEVIEFAATRMMDTNVGGYENTGWDLVSNMTGCIIAAVLLWSRRGRLSQVPPAPCQPTSQASPRSSPSAPATS